MLVRNSFPLRSSSVLSIEVIGHVKCPFQTCCVRPVRSTRLPDLPESFPLALSWACMLGLTDNLIRSGACQHLCNSHSIWAMDRPSKAHPLEQSWTTLLRKDAKAGGEQKRRSWWSRNPKDALAPSLARKEPHNQETTNIRSNSASAEYAASGSRVTCILVTTG